MLKDEGSQGSTSQYSSLQLSRKLLAEHNRDWVSCCTPWPAGGGWNVRQQEIIKHNGTTHGQWHQEKSGGLWPTPPLLLRPSCGVHAVVLAKQGQLTCFARTSLAGRIQSMWCIGLGAGILLISWKSGESRNLSANHPAASGSWLLMQCPSPPANFWIMLYSSQNEQGFISCLLPSCV